MAHEGKRHGFAGSGNSQIYTTGSVADKLSELKASEASFLKFKPLPSMTVDAGQVSDFVQKLETEKSNNNINLVQSQKGRIDSQEDRLKPFSNDGVSSLASINPSDYASMGSGGPGTADGSAGLRPLRAQLHSRQLVPIRAISITSAIERI